MGIPFDRSHPTRDEQFLGFECLEKYERHPGLLCQFGQGEQFRFGCLRWGKGRDARSCFSIHFSRQCFNEGLIGGVEVTVEQPDDGGQREATFLKRTDPGDAGKVVRVVPGHPTLSPGRIKQTLALVIPNGVD